jgi:hypothetical protein
MKTTIYLHFAYLLLFLGMTNTKQADFQNIFRKETIIKGINNINAQLRCPCCGELIEALTGKNSRGITEWTVYTCGECKSDFKYNFRTKEAVCISGGCSLNLNNYAPEGFNYKGGQALEFKTSGHKYRVWKPDYSYPQDGGILITIKMDWIRDWHDDDHAYIELTIDKTGKLIGTSIKMVLNDGNSKAFITGIREIDMVTNITNNIYNWISGFGTTCGRDNFPSVIKNEINRIVNSVTCN